MRAHCNANFFDGVCDPLTFMISRSFIFVYDDTYDGQTNWLRQDEFNNHISLVSIQREPKSAFEATL